MRRIEPPKCTCCNHSAAMFESDVWPSLRLCYACVRDVAQYIVETIQVTAGNPILLELVRGIDASTDSACRIWLPRANQTSVFRECWVQYESESKPILDNFLDILDSI